MKGANCTQHQLKQASHMLALAGWRDGMIAGNVRREDVVRLMAWYGAIRYQAGVDGLGTLERPTVPQAITVPRQLAEQPIVESREAES